MLYYFLIFLCKIFQNCDRDDPKYIPIFIALYLAWPMRTNFVFGMSSSTTRLDDGARKNIIGNIGTYLRISEIGVDSIKGSNET